MNPIAQVGNPVADDDVVLAVLDKQAVSRIGDDVSFYPVRGRIPEVNPGSAIA